MTPQEIDALRYWLAEEAPTGAGCPVGAAEMFGRALDELAIAQRRIAELENVLGRLVAIEGGAWNVERYARERQELLGEARATFAKACR